MLQVAQSPPKPRVQGGGAGRELNQQHNNMETNYKKVKDSLLSFGKNHSACQDEYKRLYAAESVEAVMAVVKDNFSWCCQFYDFADVLLAYRDQFAEHKIWINTSVEIKEGVGYLLTTEGEFNARSWGNLDDQRPELGNLDD
nr:MAG TPA: hypothetical protein [Caudoviricetes sp.]